jgi:hypothetical protein
MEPHSGKLLGQRYRLTHKIGGGAMGTVFLADDSNLRTRVVVKRNDHTLNQADVAQFEVEAAVMVNLRNDPARPRNIPLVLDFFIETDNGQFNQYLIMEYIEGESLDAMVARVGKLDEQIVLYWLDQLLEALIFLHKQTPPIIHHDIKPSNIRVSRDGATAYMVDFGIAGSHRAVGLTEGYAPPEQYTGKTSVESDLYALAATMFELLMGVSPPPSPDLASGVDALPPFDSGILPVLQQTLQKALALAPAKRTASAEAMRQALQAHIPATMPTLAGKARPQLHPLTPLKPAKNAKFFQAGQYWQADPHGRQAVRIAYGGAAQNPLLISGGLSREIKFWQLPDPWRGAGRFLKRGQPEHQDWITAVAASADGRLAATAARDHQIYLWELASGQLRRALPISALPKSMAFDPTGQWLAVACANQTVCLFALYGQGERPQTVLQLAEAAHCIAYSPDGRWLTAVGDKNSLWVYDCQTQVATTLSAPGGAPTNALNSVRFAKDGWGLAAGGDDGILHNFVAYHPDSKAPLPPERWLHLGVANRQNGAIRALALTADGNYVVSGGDDQQLYWWNVAQQRLMAVHPTPEPIFDLCLGPHRQTVIAATRQGKICLFWVNVT